LIEREEEEASKEDSGGFLTRTQLKINIKGGGGGGGLQRGF